MPLFWSGADLEVCGIFWGIAGVLLLLLFAVYRLAHGARLTERELTAGQWLALGFSVDMAYAEGYRGFTEPSPRGLWFARFILKTTLSHCTCSLRRCSVWATSMPHVGDSFSLSV